MPKQVEPDWTAVELVALDGHRMRLVGADRVAAIKLMARHKVPKALMAWRLCISVEALTGSARYYKIKLPTEVNTPHWTADYYEKRKPGKRGQPKRITTI